MRITVSRRSRFHGSVPEEPGRGTSLKYRRDINGIPHWFSVVVMPDGELRLFVRKYNGYLQDLNREAGMKFACAWTQVHAIILTREETMDRTRIWAKIRELFERIGGEAELGQLAKSPAALSVMFKIVRAHIRDDDSMPEEFLLGMSEFRETVTTHFDHELIETYDAGRELAHVMTGRRFEDS